MPAVEGATVPAGLPTRAFAPPERGNPFAPPTARQSPAPAAPPHAGPPHAGPPHAGPPQPGPSPHPGQPYSGPPQPAIPYPYGTTGTGSLPVPGAPGAPGASERPTTRSVVPAVAAGGAALVSLLISWARYAGNWANAADQKSDPAHWPYAGWLTSLEVLFALVAFGLALAVVVPKAGRRPVFVGLLVAVAMVTGSAVSDGFYQIVSSIYYR